MNPPSLPYHCGMCNSPRPDPRCWKCHSNTFVPDPRWVAPTLPEIAPIRALAQQVGYAIGEHGSKERDLDLMAMPWTATAVSAEELLMHLVTHLPATLLDTETKPLGRLAATLQLDGYYKPIDLSIAPRLIGENLPQES